jgi:hypothetical protein
MQVTVKPGLGVNSPQHLSRRGKGQAQLVHHNQWQCKHYSTRLNPHDPMLSFQPPNAQESEVWWAACFHRVHLNNHFAKKRAAKGVRQMEKKSYQHGTSLERAKEIGLRIRYFLPVWHLAPTHSYTTVVHGDERRRNGGKSCPFQSVPIKIIDPILQH